MDLMLIIQFDGTKVRIYFESSKYILDYFRTLISTSLVGQKRLVTWMLFCIFATNLLLKL